MEVLILAFVCLIFAPFLFVALLKKARGFRTFRIVFFIVMLLAYGQFVAVLIGTFSMRSGGASGIPLALSTMALPVILLIGAALAGLAQGFVMLITKNDCFTPLRDMLLVATPPQGICVYFRRFDTNLHRALLQDTQSTQDRYESLQTKEGTQAWIPNAQSYLKLSTRERKAIAKLYALYQAKNPTTPLINLNPNNQEIFNLVRAYLPSSNTESIDAASSYTLATTLQSSQTSQSLKRGVIMLALLVALLIASGLIYAWYRFSPHNPNALLNALEERDSQKALSLIAQGAKNKDKALHHLIHYYTTTAGYGKYEVMQALLESGANPNAFKGYTLLMSATEQCDTRAAKMLLESGADVSLRNENGTDVLFCIRCGDSQAGRELANLLLQYGANPLTKTADGYTALFALLLTENPSAQALINAGADVNAVLRTHDGSERLLQRAVSRANAQTIELLIQKGAKVERDDVILLFSALRNEYDNNNAQILSMLLAQGINPNKRDRYGDYPIHRAPLAQLKALIEHGADVNARDSSGNTTLLLRMKNTYDPQTILYLLESGADVNLANDNGERAKDFLENARYNARQEDTQKVREIIEAKTR